MAINKLIASMAIITVAMLTTACDRKTVFHQYNHTTPAGWEKTDTMVYHVKSMNEGGLFKEEIDMRLNGTYPFTGLCVIVEQNILPANVTIRDTLNCSFDRPDNKYTTNGISYRQYKYHLKDIQLNKGDSIEIKIRHNMMREMLPGIADIGVKIDRK
ncbi:MAG: gliding motility lipoprotein GldH [Prevotella sp.]|nr:gliding motility lipoprotein GldH [Prevotella sp.]MBO5204699.1 gliding motility lipoprotein GldH [Prevotella sp.]